MMGIMLKANCMPMKIQNLNVQSTPTSKANHEKVHSFLTTTSSPIPQFPNSFPLGHADCSWDPYTNPNYMYVCIYVCGNLQTESFFTWIKSTSFSASLLYFPSPQILPSTSFPFGPPLTAAAPAPFNKKEPPSISYFPFPTHIHSFNYFFHLFTALLILNLTFVFVPDSLVVDQQSLKVLISNSIKYRIVFYY